jgi:hypothetical protein
LKPWWRRWLGGDWGFDHNTVIHWFCMDELGIVRIYRELVCNRHTPEMLGDAIIANSYGPDGKLENYELFSFSHDAFAQKQDVNPIGLRLGAILQKAGLVAPAPSTKDKRGREQILYDYLKGRVVTGKIYNDATGNTDPLNVAQLQIAASCSNLIRTIPRAPRDEKNREEIAEFLGDDALQSSGYGLYGMFGNPREKPVEVRAGEKIENITNPTMRHLILDQFYSDEAKKNQPVPVARRHPVKRKFGF